MAFTSRVAGLAALSVSLVAGMVAPGRAAGPAALGERVAGLFALAVVRGHPRQCSGPSRPRLAGRV